jgi:hypothetical protein
VLELPYIHWYLYGVVPPEGLVEVRAIDWPLSIVAVEGETEPADRSVFTVT